MTTTVVSFRIENFNPYLDVESFSEGGEKNKLTIDLKDQKLIPSNCQFSPGVGFYNLPGVSNYILNLFHISSETSQWFYLHLDNDSAKVLIKSIEIDGNIFLQSRYPGKLNWFFGSNNNSLNKVCLIKVDDKTGKVDVKNLPFSSRTLMSSYEYLEEYRYYKSDQKERSKINLHFCYDQPYDHVDGQCGCKYSNNDPITSVWTFNHAFLKLNSNTSSSIEKRIFLGQSSYCEDNRIYSYEQSQGVNDANEVVFKELTINNVGNINAVEIADVVFYTSSQDSLIVECLIEEEGKDDESSLTMEINFFSSTFKVMDEIGHRSVNGRMLIDNSFQDFKSSSLIKEVLSKFLISDLIDVIIRF
jgi:hypothetical protein